MTRFFVVDNPDFNETEAPAEVKNAPVPGTDQDIEACFHHITHDLRASLRAIKCLPDWIRDDLRSDGVSIPEAADEYFDLLRIHAERADKLLLDLRTYSRVGRSSDRPSPQALKLVFRAALRAAKVPETFETDIGCEAEGLVAPANDLHTLATALIHNAWYHHDRTDGTIFIHAGPAGEFVEIIVGDDGPGIPEEYRQKVFQMLTTLRPRDEVEGSGMGLALVLKIAASLDGSVFARNREAGRGTEMVVRLPRRGA